MDVYSPSDVQSFICEMWAKECMEQLRCNLVWENLVDTRYESEMKSTGSEVLNIPFWDDLSTDEVQDLTCDKDGTCTKHESGNCQLVVDKWRGIFKAVCDLTEIRSKYDVRKKLFEKMSRVLAEDMEASMIKTFYDQLKACTPRASVCNEDPSQGDQVLEVDTLSYANLLCGVDVLDGLCVPQDNRCMVVSTKILNALRRLDKFCSWDKVGNTNHFANWNGGKGLSMNGIVGTFFGMPIYVSNNPQMYAGGKHKIFYFHKDAFTHVTQAKMDLRTVEMEKRFGYIVKAGHLYGHKLLDCNKAFVLEVAGDGLAKSALNAKKVKSTTS